MPGRLTGYVARLEAVATRLSSVSLECRPALDMITAYEVPTLRYAAAAYISWSWAAGSVAVVGVVSSRQWGSSRPRCRVLGAWLSMS
jgi:hypothetical protein